MGNCWKPLILLLALVGAEARASATGLVVAWDERDGDRAFIGLLDPARPSVFLRQPLRMGRDGGLRSAQGALFHVSRDAGVVTRVDPQNWAVDAFFDVGPAAELRDIAVVSPTTGYLSSAAAQALLKLDLASGEVSPAVDLRPLGVAPGVLTSETMLVDGGRLYLQLRRPLGSNQVSAVAVVDLATEALVDADPATAGIQAIALEGTEPRLKMQIIPGTRRLMLSATGALLDFGGFEAIDLDSLSSQGLVLREHLDVSVNDLGPFVMLDADRGWFSGSTSIVVSSHLHRFTLSGGGMTSAVGNVTFYFAPAVAHEPASHRVVWPVPDGLQLFDADSGVEAPGSPAILFDGDPTDLALVPLDGVTFNPGLNGNWWHGPSRSGEGVQVEVSEAFGGGLVLVANMYSYDPDGHQIFLVAVGDASGDESEVEVFITSGGRWGDTFDPALVQERQWGSGTFRVDSCHAIHMSLVPNAQSEAEGYTPLAYDLVRLTTPALPCPFVREN